MKTLIVVDVQYDFLPEGNLAVQDGDAIIPVINSIIDDYDLVIATQDWHPANHLSFASNHEDAEVFEKIDLEGLEQVLWPDHCVQGTKGAQFHKELNLKAAAAIIRKGRNPKIDSYSGFYDNGHRQSTGLHGLLQEKNVQSIDFCGLAADFCVFYSMLDALELGYHVNLIEDATKPISPENYAEQQQELKRHDRYAVI